MYLASIIVAINNEYPLTQNFFSNIFEIINEDIQIIAVVDSSPNMETYIFLEELQKIHRNLLVIYNNQNLGYSKANNIGAQKAEAQYLVFLNSDTFPIGKSIYSLVEYMDSNSSVGVAQGLILYPQTNRVQSAGHIFGFYKSRHALDGNIQRYPLVNEISERQALASAFYITQKKLFEAENGFDELYFNAWEGMEYSLKIHLKGYKCMYYPHAKAYHVKGSGRTRIFREESSQAGYFWHQWADKIEMDLPIFMMKQLSPKQLKRNYVAINASSLRNNIWQIMLKDISFNIADYYNITKSLVKKTISLEDSVPTGLIESSNNLLFLTDNFQEITGNKRIFKYRKNIPDISLDLSGNVIILSETI